AADPDVNRCRHEHREKEFELEQDDAELGQKRPDRGDRRPDPAEKATPVEAFRLDRLVLAPLLWVLLHACHCANRYRSHRGYSLAPGRIHSSPPSVPGPAHVSLTRKRRMRVAA